MLLNLLGEAYSSSHIPSCGETMYCCWSTRPESDKNASTNKFLLYWTLLHTNRMATSDWLVKSLCWIISVVQSFENIMAPFYGWGSTASRLQSHYEESSLFTTKFPEIPGTNFIDLGRMKDWVKLGATQWFRTQNPCLQINSLTIRSFFYTERISLNSYFKNTETIYMSRKCV